MEDQEGPAFSEVSRVFTSPPPVTTSFPDKAHHEWSLRMWSRMNRDQNEFLSRQELDCEEMRTAMRLALLSQHASSHQALGGGPTYARASINHIEALGYILRKADINNDGVLSFEEFKNFMWEFRQGSHQTAANIVFALFDMDADLFINDREFHEICRFYLGHNPTYEQFQEQWNLLNVDGDARGISRERYRRWLETSAHSMFTQHTTWQQDSLEASDLADAHARAGKSRKKAEKLTFAEQHRRARTFPKDACGWPLASRKDYKARPKWNQKWNWQINGNDDLPQGERTYFSRVQSAPQLARFYATHAGFERQYEMLRSPPPSRRLKVVSTDTLDVELTDPGRHLPRGTMRDHGTDEIALWEDRWQTPLRFRTRFRVTDRPIAPHALFEASHQHIGPMAPRLNRLFG